MDTYPVTMPGNDGDYVVFIAAASFAADPTAVTITPPAGFTEISSGVITGFDEKTWLLAGPKSAASANVVFSTPAVQFAYVAIATFTTGGSPVVYSAGLVGAFNGAGTSWNCPAATGNRANDDVEVIIGGRQCALAGGGADPIAGYAQTLVSQDAGAPRMFTCMWDRAAPGTTSLPEQTVAGSAGGAEYVYHFSITKA